MFLFLRYIFRFAFGKKVNVILPYETDEKGLIGAMVGSLGLARGS